MKKLSNVGRKDPDAATNATNATNASNLTGSGTISSTTTATTQAANDSSTKVATTAYVDTIAPLGPSWLKNGDFESSLTGWTSTAYSGGTVANGASSETGGASGLVITSTDATNGGGNVVSNQYIPVVASQTRQFMLSIMATAANVPLKAQVEWFTDAQVSISTSDIVSTTTTSPITDPRLVVRRIAAPATAKYCKIKLELPTLGGATGSVYFDSVIVTTPQMLGGMQVFTSSGTFGDSKTEVWGDVYVEVVGAGGNGAAGTGGAAASNGGNGGGGGGAGGLAAGWVTNNAAATVTVGASTGATSSFAASGGTLSATGGSTGSTITGGAGGAGSGGTLNTSGGAGASGSDGTGFNGIDSATGGIGGAGGSSFLGGGGRGGAGRIGAISGSAGSAGSSYGGGGGGGGGGGSSSGSSGTGGALGSFAPGVVIVKW